MAREDDLVAAERALGRVRMECNIEHDQAKAIRQDYWARLCASTASHRCSLDFHRVLCECQFILFMRETDLEWWEEKLVEEQA
jgi:hypothetical protein